MRKLILILLCLFCSVVNASATHIFGGELLYKYISGHTYLITLTLYGDCSGLSFPSLVSAQPKVSVYNGASDIATLQLQLQGTGTEVSLVCPDQLGNTTCNGGTLPGVVRYIYSDSISLPGVSDSWKFTFNGDMGASNGAGRSNSITNIISPQSGSSVMYLEANLNNVSGNNSSPQYTTIPTPFYCINLQEQYNQGAADPDNDSLAYSLITPIEGSTLNPVSYASPYSAVYPLSTASGNFNFNAVTGQMTFTPNAVQDALVDNQVSEYRHGVLIGTSMREMTFIVKDNCSDIPPSMHIDANTVSGGGVGGNNVINVCVGTPGIAFNVTASDSDADLLTLSVNNIPTGATANIVNDSTLAPSVSFNWNTSGVPMGTYYFYINLKDHHCPVSSSPTIAFTINVVSAPVVSDSVLYSTECLHQAYVQYNMPENGVSRVLTIMQGDNIIKTYTTSSGFIRDSLSPGNYTATIAYQGVTCSTSFNFSIQDSGAIHLPHYPPLSFCKGDSTQSISLVPVRPDAVVTWYDLMGDPLPAAPLINTAIADTTLWIVTEQYKACNSYPDTVRVIVHDLPSVSITSKPETICYGDKIYLSASGGEVYTWSPLSQVHTDKSGKLYAQVLTPVTFTVQTTDSNGCTNTDSVAYANIEQCCMFSYPNAFSPNGDGKNDEYGIVSYGNLQEYNLRIFNRWGQCVFWTEDVATQWDGNFGGKPCPVGTYFFYFTGQCLTGHKEKKAGNITLVR